MSKCEYKNFIDTVYENDGRFYYKKELEERKIFPNVAAYYHAKPSKKIVLGGIASRSKRHGTFSISRGHLSERDKLKAKDNFANGAVYLTEPMDGWSIKKGDKGPEYVNKISFTDLERLFSNPENVHDEGFIVVDDELKVILPRKKLPF